MTRRKVRLALADDEAQWLIYVLQDFVKYTRRVETDGGELSFAGERCIERAERLLGAVMSQRAQTNGIVA